MLSYNEIEQLIISELNEVMDPTYESLYFDIDAYELAFRLLGHEPSAEELWATTVNGGNEPGAQCFAGELGARALEFMRASARPGFQQVVEFCLSICAGRIFYYPESLTRSFILQQPQNASDETMRHAIRQMIRFVVAHERRHSQQPAELLEIQVTDLNDVAAYNAQPHEADANAFAWAVLRGETSLADVATWQAA